MKKILLIFILLCAITRTESAEYIKDGKAMAFVVRAEMADGKWKLTSGDATYADITALTKDMNNAYMTDKTDCGFYMYVTGTQVLPTIEKLGRDIRAGLSQHPEYVLLNAYVVEDGKDKDISNQLDRVNY